MNASKTIPPMRSLWLSSLTGLALLATDAHATEFNEIGQDLRPGDGTRVELSGALRLRGEALNNLDLDRGLTPSGAPLFPVPLSDPAAQTLTHGDLRLRTDLAVHSPFGGVAVKMRLDVLDNIALGGSPDAEPLYSTSQRPPDNAFLIKRAWGEALTPAGVLAAGRMGSHWGLGMLTHGGDCADCDSGDAADRVAFVTPLFGHVWAAAYDVSSIGPQTERPGSNRALNLDPADDIRSWTFAVLNVRSDLARRRRRRAGKWTLEYGAFVANQWQQRDVPASYLPLATPATIDGAQSVLRDYRALVADGWIRLEGPWMRVEAEVAYLNARVKQASLIPGVELTQEATSDQLGLAIESTFGDPTGPLLSGLDVGMASGDAAPGFGARVSPNDPAPQPGDLDGPQARPPSDNTVNNFRFHTDYRIDRILFREIIGTVTDAVYVKPHLTWRPVQSAAGRLTLSVAVISSWAMEASSTPGGSSPLGVEVDPTIKYESRDGFALALEYAALFPLTGLDNPDAGLEARTAQLLRARLEYRF